ncbi:ligase-associated DNA damage response endonuclease PdeM [Chitinophagaceae bacterium MMS25-I14]
MEITIQGTNVLLLPEKALFLPAHKTLVIADMHLGKAMHFRKSGIPIPAGAAQRDLDNLSALMQQYAPQQVWFLGDLFHSDYNSEWPLFASFIQQFPQVTFTLIRGNHDILQLHHYESIGVHVAEDCLALENLLFSHEPIKSVLPGTFNIAGHIHPGILLSGKAHQHVKLPCFYIDGQTLLLPAFGNLTGLYLLDKKRTATVYAVFKDRVFRV